MVKNESMNTLGVYVDRMFIRLIKVKSNVILRIIINYNNNNYLFLINISPLHAKCRIGRTSNLLLDSKQYM